MEMFHVFEKASKYDGDRESEAVLGVSIYRVFKSTNTRHFSLAFPVGENPLEYLNRYWTKIIGSITKTVGVESRHIAILGYVTVDKARKKPHAHMLVYSRKERKGGRCWKSVSRVEVERLVRLFKDEMQVNLKVTPFFHFAGWVDYLTGDRNLLADGFTTTRLPVYNASILRIAAKRKGLPDTAINSLGCPQASKLSQRQNYQRPSRAITL